MMISHPILFWAVLGIICAIGFFFSWLTDPFDHVGQIEDENPEDEEIEDE